MLFDGGLGLRAARKAREGGTFERDPCIEHRQIPPGTCPFVFLNILSITRNSPPEHIHGCGMDLKDSATLGCNKEVGASCMQETAFDAEFHLDATRNASI